MHQKWCQRLKNVKSKPNYEKVNFLIKDDRWMWVKPFLRDVLARKAPNCSGSRKMFNSILDKAYSVNLYHCLDFEFFKWEFIHYLIISMTARKRKSWKNYFSSFTVFTANVKVWFQKIQYTFDLQWSFFLIYKS